MSPNRMLNGEESNARCLNIFRKNDVLSNYDDVDKSIM